jgi:L-seryl-tRNA(Ser) seleniumtransferase
VRARRARDRRRGSGVLAELEVLAEEPAVRRSVRAGAALVCFSGDKLLGGPQAGLLAGRADAVARARAHPLARALRLDKLGLAALEATLRLYRDPERARRAVPVLAMLTVPDDVLAERAARLAAAIGDAAEVTEATARVGGGALPLLELPGPVVAVRTPSPDALAAALRAGDPPVVGRIEGGRLLLDTRTLADDELDAAARAVVTALG